MGRFTLKRGRIKNIIMESDYAKNFAKQHGGAKVILEIAV